MSAYSVFSAPTRFRLPAKVLALSILTVSLQSVASTGPTWLQQPSWAAGTPSERVAERRPSYARELRAANVSPFSPGSNNLSLDVGQIFLMGDLSQYTDSIGSQVHYTYGVSDLFGFDSSLGYSDHSDGKFSMLKMLAGLRTNLSWYDKVVPYVVFGMGFYRPSYQQATSGAPGTAPTSISPLLFGVHLGPGVDLELTKQLFFGTSLTFHDVFGSVRYTANGGTMDVGGTFTSFLIRAGVTF